jgi:protein TonB
MELKKSDKANLNKSRVLYIEIGLLLALGVSLLAFEWQTSPKEDKKIDGPAIESIEEEQVAPTRQEEPPPPAPEPPKVTDFLEIMSDDVKIDTHIEINTDVDLNAEIVPVEFTPTVVEEEEEIILFAIVEEKPTFNGEDAEVGFRKWVSSKIVYPPIASENGIAGRVFYEFAIDKSGNVCDIKLLRGVDPLLDAEALRVLKMSPKWQPGMQRGKPVKVRYQFPFVFQLQ